MTKLDADAGGEALKSSKAKIEKQREMLQLFKSELLKVRDERDTLKAKLSNFEYWDTIVEVVRPEKPQVEDKQAVANKLEDKLKLSKPEKDKSVARINKLEEKLTSVEKDNSNLKKANQRGQETIQDLFQQQIR